jgi:hypothetical protein
MPARTKRIQGNTVVPYADVDVASVTEDIRFFLVWGALIREGDEAARR